MIGEFSKTIQRRLEKYAWPNSVTELTAAVKRLSLLGANGRIADSDLPESIRNSDTQYYRGRRKILSLQQLEKENIQFVIKNLEGAAEILGITEAVLWRKRKAYGFH